MHIPVLKKEVIEYLSPKPNENFVDCTVGGGGHTTAILKENKPNGKVLGIETDIEIYQNLKKQIAEFSIFNFPSGPIGPKGRRQFSKRLILINNSYTDLKAIIKEYNFGPVSGILFDLGMSSWHLEESKRGFSFLRDELLDMRYNIKYPSRPIGPPGLSVRKTGGPKSQRRISNIPLAPLHYQSYGASATRFRRAGKNQNDLTAERIVNEYSEEEIRKILKEYGEERFAGRIAKKIIEVRKIRAIKTTFDLVRVIKRVIPRRHLYQRIHFATRTFQALRIEVNNELENLKEGLNQSLEVLEIGARLVVISFHSLEDRIVKRFFKENSLADSPSLEILTKKPVTPSEIEIKTNPRSRSAKLRSARKLKS